MHRKRPQDADKANTLVKKPRFHITQGKKNVAKQVEREHETLSHTFPITSVGPKVVKKPIILAKNSNHHLCKRMTNAAKNNRLVGRIQEKNSNNIMYNDRPGTFTVTDKLTRRNNLQELLSQFSTNQMRQMSIDSVIEHVSPTMQYLSYLCHPKIWIENEDKPFQTLEEMANAFQLNDADDNNLLNKKQDNTRLTEQDTMFPNINDNVGCVVIGDPNVISSALDGSLSFAESANRTIHKIFGTKEDSSLLNGTNKFKRSNDFPVFVGLDHARLFEMNGQPYKVDFYEKTKKRGKPLVPLMLTSCTEVTHRIQTRIIDTLYKCGQVKLNSQPINRGESFYRLSNEDTVSSEFRLCRSDSIMYQLYIYCPHCFKTYNHLWVANDEKQVQKNLEDNLCELCQIKPVNASCFVMKETTGRQSLDPGTARKIHFDIPKNKKETPDSVCTEKNLPIYQQASPIASPSSLKLFAHDDLSRKNQKMGALAITIFIPTVYNPEANAKRLKKELNIIGMTCKEIDLKPEHKVKLYCFHDGIEHEIHVAMTRIKLSIICNKTIELHIGDEQSLNTLRHEFVRFNNCVKIKVGNNGVSKVSFDIPSVQSTKRIGVQTVNENGNVVQHKTSVQMTPSIHANSKRQPPIHVDESGPMFSATNFWQHPNMEAKENFCSFGLSVVSGIINNHYQQGTVEIDGKKVHLLSKGDYDWIDLDEINSSPSNEVRELCRRKMTKSIRILEEKIKENEKSLKEKEQALHSLIDSSALAKANTKISELEKQITELEMENSDLLSENKYLKISLKRIESSYQDLESRSQKVAEEIVELADKAEINERRLISEVDKFKKNYSKMEKQFEKLQSDFDSKIAELSKTNAVQVSETLERKESEINNGNLLKEKTNAVEVSETLDRKESEINNGNLLKEKTNAVEVSETLDLDKKESEINNGNLLKEKTNVLQNVGDGGGNTDHIDVPDALNHYNINGFDDLLCELNDLNNLYGISKYNNDSVQMYI